MSDCTCGSSEGVHHPDCPAYLEDDSGPLLIEDILNAKRILVFVVVLTIVALAGFVIADPMDFFG